MPRLIDADALLDKFLRHYTEQEKNGTFTFVACEIKQHFADMVTDAPTVEAEPVKHGRWVRYVDSWRKCSLCGSSWNEQWGTGKALNYCPSCGAKMDGGAENA